ncbi:MAG: tetratricopeptide repeat protein [Chlamydiales bacterium]|nr:tetratricopeptide repeat protein [Chlamydiales bacterium]
MMIVRLLLLLLPCFCFSVEAFDEAPNEMGYKTTKQLMQEANHYLEKNELQKAVNAYRRAILYTTTDANAHFGLGIALEKEGNIKDAMRELQSALIFNPGLVPAYDELGKLFEKQGMLNQALSYYLRASIIDPYFSKYVYVSMKDLRTVFPERREKEVEALQSLLKKDSLKNKSVYVYADEPIEDKILFSRYLLRLRETGANVIFVPPMGMQKTFQYSMGIDVKSPLQLEDEILYDLRVPLGALPLIFNTTLTTIPYVDGYLKVALDRKSIYKDWVEKGSLRIGIAFQADELIKTIPLTNLLSFKGLSNASFYLLQGVLDQKQMESITKEMDIISLTNEITPLDELVDLIDNLDLVITADNTVANIAGALNKPVWVLLPIEPSWWWFMEGGKSYWYNSAKLFRQTKEGSWQEPVQEMQESLKHFQKLFYNL